MIPLNPVPIPPKCAKLAKKSKSEFRFFRNQNRPTSRPLRPHSDAAPANPLFGRRPVASVWLSFGRRSTVLLLPTMPILQMLWKCNNQPVDKL